MRVTCLQENLAKGLSTVGRAVATRSTLPILANVLLATDNARLKLSATNLELGISCWIGGRVERDGEITVPARLLADLIGSLPPERVDLDLDVRTLTLHVRCGSIAASLKGIDAREFPIVSPPGEGRAVRIQPDVLRDMIAQVTIAAAGDETRPVLAGVLVRVSPGQLSMVATDGYRLSMRSTRVAGVEEERQAIIPARALLELARVSADEREPIQMTVSPHRNQAVFRLSSIDLVTQLIDGAFPDYRRIMPQGHTTRTVVNTAAFQSAVRRALLYTRDANHVACLQIEPGDGLSAGKLAVSATSAALGDSYTELEASVEGEPVDIAFDARYLSDALGVIHAAEVALETTTPTGHGVLTPVGGEPLKHIIGAMHIVR